MRCGFPGEEAGRAQATMTRLQNNQWPRSRPSSTPAGPAGRDRAADHRLAQPTPTAQKAEYSHAPKQPHRRALRPGQPRPTSAAWASSMTGTTPTPRQSPSPATSPTTSTSRTPTPAARRPARATRRSTTSSPPTPRPPGQTPSNHLPTPPTCSATRAPGWSPQHCAPPTPSSARSSSRASTAR
jgi:hypothetical protein